MFSRKTSFIRNTLALSVTLYCGGSLAANLPWQNPYLADSTYPISHASPAQQDSVAVAGPNTQTHALTAEEIQFADTGPANFGAVISGPYANGKKVIWSNSLDRIVKIDHDTFEVLTTHMLPGVKHYTTADAEASVAKFNDNNEGLLAFINAGKELNKLRSLSSMYTLVDQDNVLFLGDKGGSIQAYGDAIAGDPASDIVKLREFKLPAEVTGITVGMNMTHDGWLVVVTEHGYVVTVKRDFSEHRITRLKHSEGAEEKATKPAGGGWVRNAFAVGEQGGIFIASQQHMHKVMWLDEQLTTEENSGAWTARYNNGLGEGTGATPTLMGFGDEDQFVVITDGDQLMNVTLFWRNAIPADWQAPAGAPSQRIAGMLPVTMDNPELTEMQSEQSVGVSGYGAMVVNNAPRNIPWYVPQIANPVLLSALGSSPLYQPFGVQKFQWNPVEQTFEYAWVNKEVSSPNCVPLISNIDNRAYLIGARDNQWTLEVMDWETGESEYHLVIGDQFYNSMFTATRMDEDGNIHYGSSWGRVRLTPKEALKTAQQ